MFSQGSPLVIAQWKVINASDLKSDDDWLNVIKGNELVLIKGFAEAFIDKLINIFIIFISSCLCKMIVTHLYHAVTIIIPWEQ